MLSTLQASVKSWAKKTYSFATQNKVKSIAASTSIGLLLHYIYVKLDRKWKNLPPGPIGLPLIGNVLKAGNPQTFFNYVSMTYGPIAYLTMGSQGFLVIGNSVLSKQLLEHKGFQDRPEFDIPGRDKTYKSFVQMKYNDKCIKRRKYAQSIFVASCTSKHINKILTNTMLSDLIPKMDNCCKSNIKWSPNQDLKYLTWNIVFHLNFGRSILRTDDIYKEIEYIENAKKSFNVFKIIVYGAMPFIAKIYPSFFGFEESILKRELDLYRQILQKRRSEIDDINTFKPETYCDYVLKAEHENEMNEDQAIADLLLMYIAGSDTTANTLYWGLILTAKYTNIQQRVRDELLQVYGTDKPMEFDLSKLTKLPVFRAFIFELLRISAVLPRGVPRYVWNKNGVDIEYKDNKYNIPYGTFIFNNTLYIHDQNNKNENWKNKELNSTKMNLNNWIYFDKKFNKYKVKSNSSFSAFGFGRRECIGRVVAMKVLQLFFAKILLKYQLSLDDKNAKETLIPSEMLVSYLTNKINIKISHYKS